MLASNAPETKDADFSWKEFQLANNNVLANVLGNLANRTFTFTIKNFNSVLNKSNSSFVNDSLKICETIKNDYSSFKVRKAVKSIIDLAREGNRYFDEKKPWLTIKENKSSTEEILFSCVELLRIISIIFFPIMPHKMLQLRRMMNLNENFSWDDIYKTPEKFEISDIFTLFKKIDDDIIQ
jgi:methionyl-tRNA synthetase